MYSDSTIPASQSTAISELLTQTPDNTIASGEASLVPVRVMPGSEEDWLIQTPACGGKCSELSSNPDPALWLSRIQKACWSEEVEKYLPMSEWRDIVSKTRSSYRQRKSERAIKETASLSSLSFRTLHSSNTSTNSKPAGLTKCEQSLRKLGIISPFHYLSAMGMELIFGFPLGWTKCLQSPTLKLLAKPKVESEPDTHSPKQSCPDKLTLPSNECIILPKSSELSISSGSEFRLSGLAISFGKTLRYLPRKTMTRRVWKDKHAQKFINAFHHNKLVKALDKDIRYGGKQIGWCRLLCAPYKEQLAAMPVGDLKAEGGMCSSVAEFVKQYFKGDDSLEVWVICFEFVELNQPAPTATAEALGVYSDSETKADKNSDITSLAESIHQAQLSGFGVYPDSACKIDSNSLINSATNSIHQASLASLGVYSVIQNTANNNFAIALSTPSVHQASLAPLGVYCALEPKTNSNSTITLSTTEYTPSLTRTLHKLWCNSNNRNRSNSNNSVFSTTNSREQGSVSGSLEHHINCAVYQNSGNQVNTNCAVSLPAESIHQSSTQILGVYPSDGNQSDSNATNNLLAQSIHQTLVVQGGSGLVYSFWKGESTVNHYRYKVKVNGKWKVKSLYVPVGKLPKVREAIANKLGVAAIVTEVLGRDL